MLKNEKQVLALILFGDIRGFRDFCDRVGHPESEFLPFWREWQTLLDEFFEQIGGYPKKLADGLMVIKEMDSFKESQIIGLLNKGVTFKRKVNRMIANKLTPRPGLFRLRCTFGYVWKHQCKISGHDYVSSRINLCEKMLHVHEDEPLICHESVIERIPRKRWKQEGFELSKMPYDHIKPNGITAGDLKALWKVRRIKA